MNNFIATIFCTVVIIIIQWYSLYETARFHRISSTERWHYLQDVSNQIAEDELSKPSECD